MSIDVSVYIHNARYICILYDLYRFPILESRSIGVFVGSLSGFGQIIKSFGHCKEHIAVAHAC